MAPTIKHDVWCSMQGGLQATVGRQHSQLHSASLLPLTPACRLQPRQPTPPWQRVNACGARTQNRALRPASQKATRLTTATPLVPGMVLSDRAQKKPSKGGWQSIVAPLHKGNTHTASGCLCNPLTRVGQELPSRQSYRHRLTLLTHRPDGPQTTPP